MGKGFYISQRVAVTCVVAAIGAALTIIALSVVYAQEKSKNEATTTTSPNTTSSPGPTPSTPKEPWQRYRLPDSLAPVSYNVTLWPRLEPNAEGLYIFTGQSKVVFRCVRETDLIIIHSKRLDLTTLNGHHAKLTGLNGATTPTLKTTWLEVPTQYLVVQLNGMLEADSMYELYTEFVGKLADDLGGFYRSEYMEDEVKK